MLKKLSFIIPLLALTVLLVWWFTPHYTEEDEAYYLSLIHIFLRRSGFNLPVYLLSETAVDKPEGVQAVIAGKDQEWLELEAAACDYEARLLPPFFNTLTQYVEMDNSTLDVYKRQVHLLWRQDRRPLPKLTQFIAHLQQGMPDALATTRASE